MSVELARPGKHSLTLHTPVMPAAGTFGYGDVYRDLLDIEKLGAIVTNPITYEPWSPASGRRVIPLAAGVLMHTGLPNPGLNKVLKRFRNLWLMLPVPVIVHFVATNENHVRKGAARLDEEEAVAAVELGLSDDIHWQDAEALVAAAVDKTEKPVIVRVPSQDTFDLAQAAADAGAASVVISAPPRGTARDPHTGKLVSGRVYGPLVKPMILRMVGQLARQINIPIIGAGGIHSAQDARDYIDAGAVAVQVDSVTWIQPRLLETIGRDLGGMVVTRPTDALPDEWYDGMGDTEYNEIRQRRERERVQEERDTRPDNRDKSKNQSEDISTT